MKEAFCLTILFSLLVGSDSKWSSLPAPIPKFETKVLIKCSYFPHQYKRGLCLFSLSWSWVMESGFKISLLEMFHSPFGFIGLIDNILFFFLFFFAKKQSFVFVSVVLIVAISVIETQWLHSRYKWCVFHAWTTHVVD